MYVPDISIYIETLSNTPRKCLDKDTTKQLTNSGNPSHADRCNSTLDLMPLVFQNSNSSSKHTHHFNHSQSHLYHIINAKAKAREFLPRTRWHNSLRPRTQTPSPPQHHPPGPANIKHKRRVTAAAGSPFLALHLLRLVVIVNEVNQPAVATFYPLRRAVKRSVGRDLGAWRWRGVAVE